MLYTVAVSFGRNNEYEYKFHDADVQQLPRDEARHWLHQEFEALECAPRSPVGKVILLDMILDVAKYGGEDRFAENGEWGRQFALCCAAALGRATIRVDIPNLVVA